MPEPALAFRILLSFLMTGAGALHFLKPKPFARAVPDYMPYPLTLVYVSGFFEILGGVGLMVPGVSSWAAWGLIALFVAVFPANVHMAVHRIPLGSKPQPVWLLWARLPLQGVLIAWAAVYTH